MRKAALWAAGVALALVAALAIAVLLTRAPGDPALFPAAEGDAAVTIFVVNHGYHTGVALPRSAVASEAGERGYAALINVAARFGAYPWLEIGWGEEEFYREVPSANAFSLGLALRALFMPGNRSVMHVVGLMDEPQRIFPLSEVVPARLSERGFRRLLEAVSRSFVLKDGLPEELGRGLYGPSLFFRATGTFSLLNVCNHWTGRMLAAAGLPYWPVLATVPPGVLRAVPRQRAGHLAPGRLAPKAKA